MFTTLYRCPRTIARHENGPLHESRRHYLEHLATQGAALHTIMAAAGVIYRAAIWMKLDESGPVERKDVERAAKRWAHCSFRNASSRARNKPTRSFDRLRATGCVLQADCGNQIVPRLHIRKRSMLSAATWTWSADSRQLPSQPLDTTSVNFSSTPVLDNSSTSGSQTWNDSSLCLANKGGLVMGSDQ